MSHLVGSGCVSRTSESPEMESSLWCPWSGVGWGGPNKVGLSMGTGFVLGCWRFLKRDCGNGYKTLHQFSSVSQSCPTLWPHESQYAWPPYLSPTPRVYSNSCPSSRSWHCAISSFVVPSPPQPQPLWASGSFPVSQNSAYPEYYWWYSWRPLWYGNCLNQTVLKMSKRWTS